MQPNDNCLRTTVRVRIRDRVEVCDVVASMRISGITLLIHKIADPEPTYRATYAPLGLAVSAARFNTIEECVGNALRFADSLAHAIAERRASEHMAEFAPENGLQTHDWHWRERKRFESGEYRAMPAIKGLPDFPAEHYVHPSVTATDTDMVAYTPSETHGLQDRQVRLRFGRYLRKTFPNLTDAEIQTARQEFCAAMAIDPDELQLKFATDTDTINDIFETRMYALGSSVCSCMFGKFDGAEERPYHVYADSPDVAVAYLTRGQDIVARSVVSTKDKRWVRLYSVDQDEGLAVTLRGMLEAQGYKHGDLDGNRLSMVGDRLPYIDGNAQYVYQRGGYWVVTRDKEDAEYGGWSVSGDAVEVCSECGEATDECNCDRCACCGRNECDRCDFCERCGECETHRDCECERCSRCGDFEDCCGCERCEECERLLDDCECPTCDACGRLAETCGCGEEEEEEEETENAAA